MITCNVKCLNYFNSEPQLKDTQSASKLIDLLTHLKGFQFMPILIACFKKIEKETTTKYDNFYSILKAEIITNESDNLMCFNQSILKL